MLTGTCRCQRVSWVLDQTPVSITACNCSVCHRYGALWAYGFDSEDIHLSGSTHTYRRADSGDITFHFCRHCGCVTHYTATEPDDAGRVRTAVNTRMSEFEEIAEVPLRRFDGKHAFKALPQGGHTVKDLLI